MSSATVDIAEAAKLLHVTVRRVQQLCKQGKLTGARRSGKSWSIPRSADPRLVEVTGPDHAASGFDLNTVPKHKQELAVWRLGIIQQAEAFAASAVRSGGTRMQAIIAFCKQANVAVRSLHRWMAGYKRHGIAGLVDKRGGVVVEDTISDAAWKEFLSLYLDPRQPSVRQCYDVVCLINRRHEHGWTLPSLRRMQQLVVERIPEPVRVLHRQGQAAYDAQCAPYLQTDMETIAPGSVWVGDHHQCDGWVLYRDKWIRPWLTAWMDMRSRAIVGWQLTDSPNSTTILQAFRKGCQTYGPPDAVKIDNGKDYDSYLFTGTTKQRRRLDCKLDETHIAGLYAMLNIAVSFAIPYHPQSKSIERWFDTLEGQFVRTLPTYCGKDAARRPEDLNDYLKTDRARAEALTLADFGVLLDQYIASYNNTAHTGRGMNGQTPLQVLAQRRSRRMVSDEVLSLLCQCWTGELKVGKNGVQIRGLWYGQFDQTLMMHFGRPVRCTYDPDDMRQVRVYDGRTYQYITTAQQATLTAYGSAASDSDVRQSMAAKARARKAVKAFKPAARIANTELVHLTLAAAAERTQPTAPTETTSLRPVATPLDGQAQTIRRTERLRAVKRAAGADSVRHVIDLDWDEPTATQRQATQLTWDDPEPTGRQPVRLDYDE